MVWMTPADVPGSTESGFKETPGVAPLPSLLVIPNGCEESVYNEAYRLNATTPRARGIGSISNRSLDGARDDKHKRGKL